MRILLNGETRDFPAPMTVLGLLAAIGHGDKRVAVEVNREVVPRSRHETQVLADGDRVEIIQAIGGG